MKLSVTIFVLILFSIWLLPNQSRSAELELNVHVSNWGDPYYNAKLIPLKQDDPNVVKLAEDLKKEESLCLKKFVNTWGEVAAYKEQLAEIVRGLPKEIKKIVIISELNLNAANRPERPSANYLAFDGEREVPARSLESSHLFLGHTVQLFSQNAANVNLCSAPSLEVLKANLNRISLSLSKPSRK